MNGSARGGCTEKGEMADFPGLFRRYCNILATPQEHNEQVRQVLTPQDESGATPIWRNENSSKTASTTSATLFALGASRCWKGQSTLCANSSTQPTWLNSNHSLACVTSSGVSYQIWPPCRTAQWKSTRKSTADLSRLIRWKSHNLGHAKGEGNRALCTGTPSSQGNYTIENEAFDKHIECVLLQKYWTELIFQSGTGPPR